MVTLLEPKALAISPYRTALHLSARVLQAIPLIRVGYGETGYPDLTPRDPCSQCAPLPLTIRLYTAGGPCASWVTGAPYPSESTNPLATICPGPALLPTHLPFLQLRQWSGTRTNNLRRLGPRSSTQAPAPATNDRPPSLTCDNMTTRHKPTPHFREPRQRSCCVIGLCSHRHEHTRKQLRGREQLPGPEGNRRVHTARAGLHSGRGGKSGSTRRTRAVGGRVCGRDQASEAPLEPRRRWAEQA